MTPERFETAGGAAIIVCFEAYGGGGGGDVDCMPGVKRCGRSMSICARSTRLLPSTMRTPCGDKVLL